MSNEYLNNKKFEEAIEKFQQSKREKSKYEVCINDLSGAEKRGNYSLKSKLEELNALYKNAKNTFTYSQEQLGTYFLTLSWNIFNYAKFSNIDMDDAVQESVMICFEKIDRFDTNIGKGFNYFTTVIWNSLRQIYRMSKSYTEFKKKFSEFLEANEDQSLKYKHKAKKNNNFSVDFK